MRPASLIGGIVLLLIGGLIIAGGASYYSEGQSLGGQLYQALGGTNYTALGSALIVLGGILALVGLVLVAWGFGTSQPIMAAPPQVYVNPRVANFSQAPVQPSVSPVQGASGDFKFCTSCGTRMSTTAAFCSSCGRAQG